MSDEFTSLLAAWREGDLAARDRLIGIVYPELRAIARRQLANERGDHTLQPTALVNEAYMRLSRMDRIDWHDRVHFVRMAARLMREILVDHARRHGAGKRDGGERVTLTNLDVAAPAATSTWWRWTRRWTSWPRSIRRAHNWSNCATSVA